MGNKFSDDPIEIIEGCIRRDLVAWSQFIQKYSNLVSIAIENRAKKYTATLTRHDIDDIRQNVFTSIWKDNTLASLSNRQNLAYWLAIVAGNEAVAYMRTRSFREAQRSIPLFRTIDEDNLIEFIPSKDIDPADEIAQKEISEKIDKAVESLPPREKLIVKLNLFHHKKQHEIASLLHVPKGTVASYIKRAKEKLRESLKDFK